ncbi:hypothetical protein QJS10_CPB12g00384 [Acorus calamus]|uniref:Wall-associated receptor kinase C-terminal domain-containing protein n=1 Tax=Acorus calamus TaxID=4465 RepID=A0AAV9DM36_ACOCL|nr:hypothetical protein QJS10_CPB12g00384 [Acorus calamus]
MDNLTQLMIYNMSYSVKYVDYVNQIMTIADMAYMNKDYCPLPTRNTSLDFSLFDYMVTDRNVSYYYCSSQAVGVSSLHQLSCDACTGTYDYYFTVGDRVDESCTGLVYFIPIYASFTDSLNVTDAGKALMSLKEALREGFDVNWKPGKGWCEGCVGSGGRCGYDPSKPNDPLCFYSLQRRQSKENTYKNRETELVENIDRIMKIFFNFPTVASTYYEESWHRGHMVADER